MISLVPWLAANIPAVRYPSSAQYLVTLSAFILLVLSVATTQFVRTDIDSSFATLPSGTVLTVPSTYPYTGLTAYSTIATATNSSGNVTYAYTTYWTGTNYTTAAILANLTFTRTAAYYGLFYSCSHSITGVTCTYLNSDCETPGGGVMLPDCDQFSSIAAFALLALLFLGISLIFRTLNALCCEHGIGIHKFAGLLNVGAFVFSTIAVSVGLNWVSESVAIPSSHLGYTACLLIVGWLLTVRLALMWNREQIVDPKKPAPPTHDKDGVQVLFPKDGAYIC